jgi:hypothetical protein
MSVNAPFGIAGLSVVGSALLLAGCMGDPRTTNQGGGNLISATTKLFDQHLNQLTPDEVQIVTDLVSDLVPDVDLELSDEVAGAVAELLSENNVARFDEVETLVKAIVKSPESISVPAALTTLFVSDRTANQGGGSVMSAIGRIHGGALDQLTPDEVQIMADLLIGVLPGVDRMWTDAEAERVVAFLQTQNIQTLDQAEDLLAVAQDDPDAFPFPSALEQLLADLDSLSRLKKVDLSHLDLGNLF